MAELPVTLGAMEAVPPALRYRVTDVLRQLPVAGEPLEGASAERLARLLDEGAPWLGADPALVELGMWMLEARHSVALRQQGCVWLTMFPSADTATRLASVALDPASPAPVRESAIWSLGYRQLRAMHPRTQWAPDAVQIADEALIKLADAATTDGKIASDQLPQALRHVQADALAAVFARAPGMWGEALECFATPPLARVLFVSIDAIPPPHRLRALRLIAATIGEDAVPLLLARANQMADDERIEMLCLAISMAGEAHLGRLEDALRGMPFADLLRERARWHLANRWVVPTVRGLRVARSTAVLTAVDRPARCAQAADDLAAMTRFARHSEPYLYTLWGWMVRGAADPARARALVTAHPDAQRLVRDLYLEDLARRGQVTRLTAVAQSLAAADLGALQLAIWGRPLAALELAATARSHTPELVAARALACYRAGRPDLTERILADDLPPSEITDDATRVPFPGPHETWMIKHASSPRPVLAALASGRAALLGLARPAAHDAEADRPTLDSVGAVVRRLDRGLLRSTVYLAGDFEQATRAALAAAVVRAGARLVAGPFPGTDFYVQGDRCRVAIIAQLERQGARRLRDSELEAG